MIQSVKTAKEIVVISENKVGALSGVSKALAERGINILAISAQSAGKLALLNFVVDEYSRAVDLLRKKGFPVQENNVLLIELEDQPGVLRNLTRKLAGKKIDLLNLYGSTSGNMLPCTIVLASSDNQKALVALKK